MTVIRSKGPSLLDVEAIIPQLTMNEKVALLSGIDFWHTAAVPRFKIPSVRMSDGPNGIRGTKFFNGVPAACFPCGTALGATWDHALLESAGRVMGAEARAKGAAVILGPTVNIQRSPLGGRGFESFSEDPLLAGSLAAAEIRGIQESGISATIKHFVCNDQEHERQAVSADVSQRALREIYLMPFMIAMRDSNPKAFMTGYNKLNGLHCSENKELLQGILRDEWGFKGLVMSDWYGTYSTSGAINAGLDLEMPGPFRFRGNLVNAAVGARKITKYDLDERVRNVLNLVNHAIASGIPEDAPEEGMDTKETAALLRQIGADSLVLLKNEGNVLPLSKEKTVAVIGPNAKVATIFGGGSASLRPYYAITPYDGIAAQAKDIKYAVGAMAYKRLPDFGPLLKVVDSEKAGFSLTFFTEPHSVKDRKAIDTLYMDSAILALNDYKNPLIKDDLFYTKLEGLFYPEMDGVYEFGLTCHGTAELFVSGSSKIDNTRDQVPGDSFFGAGTIEMRNQVELKAGTAYNITVEFGSAPTSTMVVPGATSMGGGGFILGGTRALDAEEELVKAVNLAKEVDQVIICAGLNSEFESEGYDRPHMDLPGHLDELITRVSAANPQTVLVMQSGTPVTMPWLSSVPAVVQAWYGGNETGNAIADVIFGDVNPSAKLPLSFPAKVEHNPAFTSFRSELGRTVYTDDVFVGYRGYEIVGRDVNFPFGHGLSYTTFSSSNLALTSSGEDLEDVITVSVDVQNTGSRDGKEVVQVWVKPPVEGRVLRAKRELKGFTKVALRSGETKKVRLELRRKDLGSFWDQEREMWVLEKGEYGVVVGREESRFVVGRSEWWRGL